jgi:hypothetical protein
METPTPTSGVFIAGLDAEAAQHLCTIHHKVTGAPLLRPIPMTMNLCQAMAAIDDKLARQGRSGTVEIALREHITYDVTRFITSRLDTLGVYEVGRDPRLAATVARYRFAVCCPTTPT